MSHKHPLNYIGRILFSLDPLENPSFASPNERKITRYMYLLVKLKETGSLLILQSGLSGRPWCCRAAPTPVWFTTL